MQKEKQRQFYFDTCNPHSITDFSNTLYELLTQLYDARQPLVFLCVGSDRATGDCLGPLLGYMLNHYSENKPGAKNHDNFFVYGTLSQPVHAKNLNEIILTIYNRHNNPFIIAVDASLGKASHIGYYTLGEGPLKPGAGVNKELPDIGDIHITGIVNMSGLLDQMLLQTTRLNIVMKLVEQIYSGIHRCLKLIEL